MNITEPYTRPDGVEYIFEYTDADSFEDLPLEKCRQCYGVCFYEDKLVIGYNGKGGHWSLVGGTVEPGETLEQALRREIQEESNMEVLSCRPIGYQKVINVLDNTYIYQLRYMCIVRPYGPFVSDPAGSVTAIKCIEPSEYKKYFDWRTIGDRIMERAEFLKKE